MRELPVIPGYIVYDEAHETPDTVTYRAFDIASRNEVAIDVLRPASARNERSHTRFIEESEQLSHEHDRRVLAHGEHAGVCYRIRTGGEDEPGEAAAPVEAVDEVIILENVRTSAPSYNENKERERTKTIAGFVVLALIIAGGIGLAFGLQGRAGDILATVGKRPPLSQAGTEANAPATPATTKDAERPKGRVPLTEAGKNVRIIPLPEPPKKPEPDTKTPEPPKKPAKKPAKKEPAKPKETEEEKRLRIEREQYEVYKKQYNRYNVHYYEDKDNKTKLHNATNLVQVKVLLELGADLFAEDKSGSTPLHYAAGFGYEEVVRYMVNYGAYVNYSNKIHATPLHFAAKGATNIDQRGGSNRIVTYLLNRGAFASIDQQLYTTKQTPLHLAVEANSLSNVHALVEYGADVNSSNVDFQTPLHLAASRGFEDILAYLAANERILLDLQDKNGATALHLACNKNDVSLVAILTEAGAWLEHMNKKSQTPLRLVTDLWYTNVLRHLIAAGAYVDPVDPKTRQTPLYEAILRGDEEMVFRLHEHEANVNFADLKQRTPLHFAASNGNLAIARFLLDNGGLLSAKDSVGNTPLHYAAHEGHGPIVALFLQTAPNIVYYENKEKKTALDIAQATARNTEAMAMLTRAMLRMPPHASNIAPNIGVMQVGEVDMWGLWDYEQDTEEGEIGPE